MTPNFIQKPIISEKATDLNAMGKYVFMVEPHATKNEVKKAIHALYKVDVVDVNILIRVPKTRRYRGIPEKRGGYKKAIVTLKKGQTIEVQ